MSTVSTFELYINGQPTSFQVGDDIFFIAAQGFLDFNVTRNSQHLTFDAEGKNERMRFEGYAPRGGKRLKQMLDNAVCTLMELKAVQIQLVEKRALHYRVVS